MGYEFVEDTEGQSPERPRKVGHCVEPDKLVSVNCFEFGDQGLDILSGDLGAVPVAEQVLMFAKSSDMAGKKKGEDGDEDESLVHDLAYVVAIHRPVHSAAHPTLLPRKKRERERERARASRGREDQRRK
ncbi:MAG: hypothetical protein Q9171_004513 [Xanthocarpia ochracea]